MVIFPIADERTSAESVSVWPAIEGRLKQNASAYWLVTQPSHAALAGDLAAALREDLFGPIDQTVARSIALHDAGWSMEDAEFLVFREINKIYKMMEKLRKKELSGIRNQKSGALNPLKDINEEIYSFATLKQKEIDELKKLEAFRKREKERQQMLRTGINHEQPALERLVDALQFCDALSLYLCCGSSQTIKFERPALTVSRRSDEYRIQPSPFSGQRQFSFSALRHPVLTGKSVQSGATFHINI